MINHGCENYRYRKLIENWARIQQSIEERIVYHGKEDAMFTIIREVDRKSTADWYIVVVWEEV
jgi:hypothetical protein